MAIFTNQAQLLYGGQVINSNIAVGEITDVLSVTKTAVQSEYGQDDRITYIISLVNTGEETITELTVSDNLGAYEFGEALIVPLDYVADTLHYFLDGALQATPTITDINPLTVTGIQVPANGNATIIYEAATNTFTPHGLNAEIVNTVTVEGACTELSAEETVESEDEAILSVAKSITPVPVQGCGEITYTFHLQNAGNTAVLADGDAQITDTFEPILTDLVVTFNGATWTEGVEYTYNENTGLFRSVPGQVTVPEATFVQNTETGAWEITPGMSTLTISGYLTGLCCNNGTVESTNNRTMKK